MCGIALLRFVGENSSPSDKHALCLLLSLLLAHACWRGVCLSFASCSCRWRKIRSISCILNMDGLPKLPVEFLEVNYDVSEPPVSAVGPGRGVSLPALIDTDFTAALWQRFKLSAFLLISINFELKPSSLCSPQINATLSHSLLGPLRLCPQGLSNLRIKFCVQIFFVIVGK